MATIGIDLSASGKTKSHFAILDKQATLEELGAFQDYDELLAALEKHQPTLVAIDAPLCLPQGLCCLEEGCSCVLYQGRKGRVSEMELARMGIGCFYTTKRSIIKRLIYRGVWLRNNLINRGYQVIEVYPYATKVLLFGDQVPAKKNPACLPFLRERMGTLINGLDPHVSGLNHDRCDALLTAYTGYLHQGHRTDSLGLIEEGVIALPHLHH